MASTRGNHLGSHENNNMFYSILTAQNIRLLGFSILPANNVEAETDPDPLF